MDITLPAIAVALSALALGMAYALFKLRRIHLKLFSMEGAAELRLANHFSQLEALLALHSELKLDLALQPTRGWAGSPDFLLQVLRAAVANRATAVLECSSGVSTVVLARAMQMAGSGHVWSLEHELAYAEKTRSELQRQGLGQWATVLHAPLRSTTLAEGVWRWYDVGALPELTFDMLVIDGPPMTLQPLARFPAIPVLGDRLAQNAIVVLDDADRPDERELLRQWKETYRWDVAGHHYAEKGIAILRRSLAS